MVDAALVAGKTGRVIRQNIGWAIIYNLLAVPLAAAGALEPWMAAIGMSLSSLVVVVNALRLQRGELNMTGSRQKSDTSAAAEEAVV